MQLNVYIYFNGNCEEAMNFYKETLGGSIDSIVRYSDAPKPSEDGQQNKVLHGVMHFDGTKVFFCDSTEKHRAVIGDNFSLSLSFNSEEELNKAFAGLSAGGRVIMPVQDTFWGARFGMCADKFDVHWMFNWDKPKA